MSLKQRVLKGDTISIEPGKSLLESLWAELLKEWADPDPVAVPISEALADLRRLGPEKHHEKVLDAAFDQGYCVGLAYAVAKIQSPYSPANARIESVIQIARARKKGIDYSG